MIWNYRACVEQTKHGPVYTVREVFYYDAPGAEVEGFTAEGCSPQGETRADLERDVEMMLADIRNRHVLDITDPDNPVEVP